MASSTKYQRAPQEEPDEDYTHAPPAYAEASSSNDETQGLFGAPRSSEDNIPDDFKVCFSRWVFLLLFRSITFAKESFTNIQP